MTAGELQGDQVEREGIDDVAVRVETPITELVGQGIEQIGLRDESAPAENLAETFVGPGLLCKSFLELGLRDQPIPDQEISEFRGLGVHVTLRLRVTV